VTRVRFAAAATLLAACLVGPAVHAQDSTSGLLVAVDEVYLPSGFADREATRAFLDSTIAARLTEAGYRLVPPDRVRLVWNRIRDSVGGFYDTYTGRVIDEKYQAVYRTTRAELRDHLGARAWLTPTVRFRSVWFGGGKVEWDGVKEETGGRGGLEGFLFGRHTGLLTALSLRVEVEDMSGAITHRGWGGIQLAMHLVEGKLARLPPDSLLLDTGRIANAVRLALDSLAIRLPPHPAD